MLLAAQADSYTELNRALDGQFHVVLTWSGNVTTWGTITSVVVLALAMVGGIRVLDLAWAWAKRSIAAASPSDGGGKP